MKNDARMILNKKKWKNSAINQITKVQKSSKKFAQGAMDARKILNLKRSKKFTLPKRIFQSPHKSNVIVPVFKRTLSATAKNPLKQVALARDGNIVVTAKSSNVNIESLSQRTSPYYTSSPSSSQQQQKPVHQWVPADVNMDNIEHIGISDVIDMEALPHAVVSPSVSRYILPSDTLSMQHTMVADQVASSFVDQGVRVLVTNLCLSVSKQDIAELFLDVGLVKSAEMPQPGTAIIEFYSAEDAKRACSTYHDRLLDGQPMKCYLQAKVSPQRISLSQRLGDRIQSTASVPTLPSNSRSRFNPRDVRFTVKLP